MIDRNRQEWKDAVRLATNLLWTHEGVTGDSAEAMLTAALPHLAALFAGMLEERAEHTTPTKAAGMRFAADKLRESVR